jgi:hypothetical protein
MTPQSTFMVLAPVSAPREAELRALLASMNDGPGRLKADTPLVPFAAFPTVHFARLLLVDDKTTADIRVYGIEPPAYPLTLAFVGDVDGDADAFLEEAARIAAPGLRALFSCCQGFDQQTDLLEWMRAHHVGPAARYVNWRGRTVAQIREEVALREALAQEVRRPAQAGGRSARDVHAALRRFVQAEVAAGRLSLSPPAATPLRWAAGDLLHLVGGPLLVLLALPLLLPLALVLLVRLRRLEKTDPDMFLRADPALSAELASLEDHDVTNQFSVVGSVKPGWVRRVAISAAMSAIDYGARHVYVRGRLARVRTIHFARWVFLDGRRRVLFMSNYDGSLEGYMDDFINKVGFGLNLAFSHGVGYPRTDWVLLAGCRDERPFKEVLRRHQIPTQVWYKAYPGLTAVDLERNTLIRAGVEAHSPSEDEARRWVALL